MPAATLPDTPRHLPPPPTKEELDFADLSIIDLAKYATAQGKAELINDVRDAMNTTGFFYVINHGYTPEQTRRIFDIAEIPFAVEEAEKKNYIAPVQETGTFQGYKPRQFWHIDAGVRDQIEHYNIHTDVSLKEHPEALRPFLPEIDAFICHNHFNILLPLFRLLALGLELPEDAFVKLHTFQSAESETYLRTMKYFPRSSEDEDKTKNVWLKGHTDTGSLSLVWSQPVSGLQILTSSNQWKWVKHIDNALVVNAGDSLSFLSGGFYKPTIHRVHQPPLDQRNLPRLGLFYFAFFDEDVKLAPLEESPVLKRVGIVRRVEAISGAYRKGRFAAYGLSNLREGKEKGVEEEEIEGVLVKHYN